MQERIGQKQRHFNAQGDEYAAHERVDIHGYHLRLSAPSNCDILREKGRDLIYMKMPLGAQKRIADQNAELEFRESMQNQLEEANRKLQTQIDDARTEANAAKREARIAFILSVISTAAGVAGVVFSVWTYFHV